jgi:cation transporter-like permease
MATAALASVFIETFMVIVVLVSHKYHINPHNVATPIAGCMGDLVGFINNYFKIINSFHSDNSVDSLRSCNTVFAL